MIGKTISHYRILDKLGEGGMGLVYKAEDTKLKRTVALKFLRSDALSSDDQKARFVREAQSAAALDHPNICTIYEIDEANDLFFISMAYATGVNLKEKIQSGPLDVEEVVRIGVQIARGLDAAHRKDIIHRDIKSANIMITKEGRVRITDFGLAKTPDAKDVAKTTTSIGTAAYMSPEQARGDTIDPRTDVWSLGVCLYEMLTGRLPFGADYESAVVYAVLNNEAPSIADVRPDVPEELVRIVTKAIAKDPADRFQSAADLRQELDLLRKGPAPVADTKDVPSIAVLPFADMSPDGDQEFFCDGIAEEIINALTQLGGIHVVARTSAFSFKGKTEDVRKIGETLNVRSVLEGSVRKAGDRLRITAQLINVDDGYHLWSERFDRRLEDVFAVQDEISQAIVDALKIKLIDGVGQPVPAVVESSAGDRAVPIVKRHTENIEAYSLYLRGRFYWNRRSEVGLRKSIEYFEQAIALDPNYALAWAGLADTHNMYGFYACSSPEQSFLKAKEEAVKALGIDNSITEAHTSLAYACMYYDRDWETAEREFKQAIELNPNYATARHWYANFLSLMGRHDEALEQAEISLDFDPFSLIVNTYIGWNRYFAKEYAQSIRQYERTLEMDTEFAPAHFFLGLSYIRVSMFDEAISELQKAVEYFGGGTLFVAAMAYAHASAGQKQEALRIVDELKKDADRRYFPESLLAATFCALGDKDQAMGHLEKAYDNRDMWIATLGVDPIWDCLRDNPRFKNMLATLKLPSGSAG